MSEQIAVRLPDDLASRLDELIASGRFGSKAEAVRAALRAMLEAERRRGIGQRIAEGYRRLPQTDEEVAAATAAAIRSIQEEPW
jgi:putative addiction module CopG family antidote